MNDLSERQKQILKHIINEYNTKGYPPSVREIGKAVGLKSPASVHNHLKTLEKLNYIKRDPDKPRAIEILKGNEGKVRNEEIVNIPILGKVTAGIPVLADENIEDYFPLPINYFKSGNNDVFMLQVDGESMINAGIHDGDYVIAKKQQKANNGDIIIALLEDETTVKRYIKRKDYVELLPENDDFSPIKTQNIAVLGKVIGLFRSID
ncbi:MAG: transcriptional repressor LexA [Bacillota bacterium]